MKFWMVYTHKNAGKLEQFNSLAEATERAIWLAHQDTNRDPVFILAPVTVCRRPLPTDISVRDVR